MAQSEKPARLIALLLVGILGSLAALFAVYRFFTPVFAVKASYTTIGLSVALLLVGLVSADATSTARFNISSRQSQKAVVSLACCSLALLTVLESMTIVLSVLIPLGYSLLLLQYIQMREVTPALVAQLGLLFLVAAAAKPAVTHFYIGYMDLIKHANFTQQLIQAGTPSAITSNYEGFFALHTVAGVLSETTKYSAHTSILLSGVVSFTALVGVLYAFLRRYTGSEPLAFLSVLLVSASSGYLYYANYFYPQSLALTFCFILLFVAVAARSPPISTPMVVAGFVVSIALVITHHFTFVLMLPIFAWLLATGRLTTPAGGRQPYPLFGVLVMPYLMALYYWGDAGQIFFAALFGISSSVISTFWSMGVAGGGGGGNLILLGVAPISRSVSTAAAWLISVNGLYQISLVTLLSLGAVCFLLDINRAWEIVPLFVLGFAGAVLILDTPLSIKSLSRLSFPLSIFVFVVCGLGLKYLIDSAESHGISAASVSTVFFVGLFVSSGLLMGAADVGQYDGVTDPKQASISNAEYSELQAVSDFANKYRTRPVTTFAVLRFMLGFFDTEAVTSPRVTDTGIKSTNAVVYNEQWPSYRLRHAGDSPYLTYVRMSESWLYHYTTTKNTVYDAGVIGIVENGSTAA